MHQKLILGLIFLLCSQAGAAAPAAQCATSYYILGGGGDGVTKDNKTVFDSSLESLSKKFPTAQGQENVHIFFDGNHQATQSQIQTQFAKAHIQKFTVATYQDFLNQVQDDLVRSKPCQMMIMINTHGSPRESSLGVKEHPNHQVTHSVSAEDGVVDLDQLMEVLQKNKKTRVALVDTSCHSGASLVLGDEHTCVISSASDDYGYTDFGSNFANSLAKNKSLETSFLEAREKSKFPSIPQISTNAGLALADLERERLMKILVSKDKLLRGDYEKNLRDEAQCHCRVNSTTQRFTEEIKGLRNLISLKKVDPKVAETLIDNLAKYLKIQKDVEAKLKKAHPIAGEPDILLKYKYYDRGELHELDQTISPLDLARMRFDFKALNQRIDYAKKDCAKERDPVKKNICNKDILANEEEDLRVQTLLSHRQTDLLKLFPSLSSGPEAILGKDAEDLTSLDGLLGKIVAGERAVYKEIYKNESLRQKTPEPCAQWKF